MAKPPSLPIYWDTTVIIDHLEGTPRALTVTPAIVLEANLGSGSLIYTSTAGLLETIRVLGPKFGSAAEAFFGLDGTGGEIRIIPFDLRVAKQARVVVDMVKEQRERDRAAGASPLDRVPFADSIHIATALAIGARCLHTYDDTHLTRWHQRLGLPIHHPTVQQPMLG